jgi:hypothetical protein
MKRGPISKPMSKKIFSNNTVPHPKNALKMMVPMRGGFRL